MERQANTVVTPEDTAKDSPNVLVEHIAGMVEGDPEAIFDFTVDQPTVDEQGRPVPRKDNAAVSNTKWAAECYLPGINDTPLTDKESKLLGGLY
jgi:hypothetical protein